MQERTFFMLKPDAIARGLEAEIIKRVEVAGLKIVQKQKIEMDEEQAANLYAPHLGKKFYPGLIQFITSGPVICTMVEGEDVVPALRVLMGATDPRQANAGTIRGDLREENVLTPDGTIKNLVHGSDSPESAEREIGVFFNDE